MKKILKKIKILIVPTKENNYRPYFLLSNALFFIVISLFILKIIFFVFLFSFPKTNLFIDVSKSVLLTLTNNQRVNNGISILRENAKLNQAAYLKAKDMLDYDYFAHTSPSGKSPWYWLDLVGYNYQYAGENLAIDFLDSEQLFQAWYASSTHRANIINPKFNDIGIAVVKGEFKGRETTVVVQYFGTEIPVQTVQAKTPTVVSNKPTQPVYSGSTPSSTSLSSKKATTTPSVQPKYVSTPGGMTLYEYYKQKGQALPSISERAKLYEKLGLGPASSYHGYSWQNNLLLNKLLEIDKKTKSSAPQIVQKPKSIATPTPTLTPKITPKPTPTKETFTSTPSPTTSPPSTSERKSFYTQTKNIDRSFPKKTIDFLFRNYDYITNIIFLTVFGVVFLSLCIDIFVKFNIQHGDIILRGVIYSLILLFLFLLDKEVILKLIAHPLAII